MLARLWLILLLIYPGYLPATASAAIAPLPEVDRSMTCVMQMDGAGCCCGPTGCPCIVKDHEPDKTPVAPALPGTNGRDVSLVAAISFSEFSPLVAPTAVHDICDSFYRQRHLPIRSFHILKCLWLT